MSVQWLADYLGAENLVILDAGVPALPGLAKAGYLTGHIPGAVFADIAGLVADPGGELGLTRPSIERFETVAALVGVLPSSTVIVYDNADSQFAAYLWWLFRSFGFDQVAVLDGGLAKWRLEDRATEAGEVSPGLGRVTAIERPAFWADRDECARIASGAADGVLVTSPAAGRIIDPSTHAFVSRTALVQEFGPRVASTTSRLVINDEGIGAAASALALTLAGHTDIAILGGLG